MISSMIQPMISGMVSGGAADSPVFSADYFGYDGSTFAWYGSPTGDNAFYDATGDKTYIAYEAWEGTTFHRIMRMAVYDHATSTWASNVKIGESVTRDDDHGVPSMVMDNNGRIHIFYGPHNGPMRYNVTTNARDTSSWQVRPNFTAGNYAYPHALNCNGVLALIMRKNIASTKMQAIYQKSTAIAGSTVTWQAEKIFGDFGTDTRYYVGATVANGNDVHMVCTMSNYNDDYRVHVYYLILDTSTDTIRNIDNSYSVVSASWPINLADHNSYFRIYTHDTANDREGHVPSMTLDNNGYPHVLFYNYEDTGIGGPVASFALSDLLYMNWNGSAWSTPEVVGATSQRTDDASITHIGSGAIQILYPYDDPAGPPLRGGDMYIRTRSAGGVWDTASIVRNQEVPYGLDRAKFIKSGKADMRWIFLEAAPTSNYDGGADTSDDVKAGYQRVFACGDSGIKGRTVTKTVSLSATQISDGRSIGDTVAIIKSDSPRNVYTIEADPDSKFSISGNMLKLAATINQATKSSHSVTIKATLRGKSVTQTFTLNVIPADTVIDAMIGEWVLNEGSGRVLNDSSPRGLDGYLSTDPVVEFSQDPTWDSTGLVFGTSGNKFARIPYADFMNTSQLHVIIVMRNTGSNIGTVLNRRGWFGDTEQNWGLASENRKLKALTYNASGSIVGNYTTPSDCLVDATWHMVEMVINGTALALRVGGSSVGSTTLSAGLVTSGKDGSMHIGSFYTDNLNYNGRVGYLAVYSIELTGADLTAAKARASAAMLEKGVTV